MSIKAAMLPLLRSRRARPDGGSSPRPDPRDMSATFRWLLEQGLDTRPHYLWGMLLAVRNASVLGLPHVAAIEFGVAGGNGLVALERAAAAAAELIDVQVEIYGFDGGTGMPPPTDHRDLPWLIKEGFFPMDERLLQARLRRAQLVLGPVAKTVPQWTAVAHAPVGFVAFDLDYYSSTMEAFALLEAPAERLLPRVICYFDDLFGYGWSDFAGERAAIVDFNAAHQQRKLGKIHGLRYDLPESERERPWAEQMYLAHLFDHPEYCTPEGAFEGPGADRWFGAHRLSPES